MVTHKDLADYKQHLIRKPMFTDSQAITEALVTHILNRPRTTARASAPSRPRRYDVCLTVATGVPILAMH